MKTNVKELPNRGHLTTEQRSPASAALDALSVEAALSVMNSQDMDVPKAVKAAIPAISATIKDIVRGMREGGRLVYIGAGTSGRLGVLDASEIPPTFQASPDQVIGIIAGGDSALRKSSEGMEDDFNGAVPELEKLKLGPKDTLIGIAAGGTTPYVWGGIHYAKSCGATTAIICCVPINSLLRRDKVPPENGNGTINTPPPPSLPAEIDHSIELIVGPEVVTGSTRLKAGTATKLALNMISTITMVQLGKVWGNLMVDLKASNEKLTDRAIRIICSQTDLDRARAAELLIRAGGMVKTALVMELRSVSAEQANRLLAEHNGQLRPILGPPR
ncbi:MAG: N-acetylmuramic acid 6-phosphate etherase [Phycisphaeraceae bacterium]